MYIRRTKVKGGPRGEVYITHRLVESVRTERGVRQRTLLNLGKDFPVPPERWPELIQHLDQVLSGQSTLVPLPGDLEGLAQRLAALLLQAQSMPQAPQETDYIRRSTSIASRCCARAPWGWSTWRSLRCVRLSSTPSLQRGGSMHGRCRRRWG